jgi:hypothetical protein
MLFFVVLSIGLNRLRKAPENSSSAASTWRQRSDIPNLNINVCKRRQGRPEQYFNCAVIFQHCLQAGSCLSPGVVPEHVSRNLEKNSGVVYAHWKRIQMKSKLQRTTNWTVQEATGNILIKMEKTPLGPYEQLAYWLWVGYNHSEYAGLLYLEKWLSD